MSSYRGVCVLRLSTGEIHRVKVVDSTGLGNVLDPKEYVRRGIQPLLEQLPDCPAQ